MPTSEPKKNSKGKDVERLKQLREQMGLNIRELAEEFQVTSGAITKWETGANPIPGPVLKLIELYEHKVKAKKK